MAEERNLATARATTDAEGEEEFTKAELQRRMEEARESISQTVNDIKDTVTNQYYSVKESVNDALDWREQYRRRPVAWSVGALSVGFLTGYCIAGFAKGDRRRRDLDTYPTYEETDAFGVTGATPDKYSSYEGQRRSASSQAYPEPLARAYAAHAITGSDYGSSGYEQSFATTRAASESARSDSSDGNYYAAEEPQKPGLIERFKGTQAFDRLQSEVSSLGDRFVDELSKTAQTVVLPALFGKVKELFGVDLSGRSSTSQQPQRASVSSQGASATRDRQASQATSERSGDDERYTLGNSSYGTSENRGYGAEMMRDRDEQRRGASDYDRDDYGRSGSSGL